MYVWEFIYLPWIWGLRCVLVWYTYLWNWLKVRTANIISRSVSKLATIFPKVKKQWLTISFHFWFLQPAHFLTASELWSCWQRSKHFVSKLCPLIWGSISSSLSPQVKVASEKVLHSKLSDACIGVFEWQIALKVRKCFECSFRVSKWYIYPVQL